MVDGSVRVRGVTAWLVHLLVKLLRICGRFTREEHLLARSALCGIWLRQENHLSNVPQTVQSSTSAPREQSDQTARHLPIHHPRSHSLRAVRDASAPFLIDLETHSVRGT